MKSYFNCPQSPDLAVMERTVGQFPRYALVKYPHWDDATLETLIKER